MTSNEILKADLLDILFDNRNKNYGAYTLRKQYNRRLIFSLAISLSTGLLFFLLISSGDTSKPIDKGDRSVVIKSVPVPPDLKRPEPALPKRTQAMAPVQQAKLTTFSIVKDFLVKHTVPALTDLKAAIISNLNISGLPAIGAIPVSKDTVSGTGQNDTRKNTSFEPFQREPEFPGGTQAWMNFLRKNLIPPGELEPGDKKTIIVRFLVDTDGSVTGFDVVQSGGKAYDGEVIRVLKKMPKWKPAIQNGEPAPRAFTQPVTFIGQED